MVASTTIPMAWDLVPLCSPQQLSLIVLDDLRSAVKLGYPPPRQRNIIDTDAVASRQRSVYGALRDLRPDGQGNAGQGMEEM
jgi:hypothetical protein